MSRISSFRETGERHGVLRFLATICKMLGYLLVGFSALVLIGGFLWTGSQMGPPGALTFGFGIIFLWSLGIFAAGIQSIAFGSLFLLAIQVEENTRATAQALNRLRPAIDLKADADPGSMFLS